MPDQLPVSTVRLALMVAGLVLALLVGFGLGRLNPHPSVAAVTASDHAHASDAGHHGHTVEGEVGGLLVTSAGYTLAPLGAAFVVGRAGEFRFQIRDGAQQPVTRFAIVHDKPMHLIVVRRDLTGYQHLHPTMAADGTWSVPLTLPEPGVWRAFADFSVLTGDGGEIPMTLGVDLVAPGAYTPRALPEAARSASAGGFTVDYQGSPQVGVSTSLVFRVRAGDATAILERYLGAFGHLVVLREGDLGYLHVHPAPEQTGEAVTFELAVSGPGRYRLYFDFQVSGVVRTAEFTLTVS